jgi:hypothetical protein
MREDVEDIENEGSCRGERDGENSENEKRCGEE